MKLMFALSRPLQPMSKSRSEILLATFNLFRGIQTQHAAHEVLQHRSCMQGLFHVAAPALSQIKAPEHVAWRGAAAGSMSMWARGESKAHLPPSHKQASGDRSASSSSSSGRKEGREHGDGMEISFLPVDRSSKHTSASSSRHSTKSEVRGGASQPSRGSTRSSMGEKQQSAMHEPAQDSRGSNRMQPSSGGAKSSLWGDGSEDIPDLDHVRRGGQTGSADSRLQKDGAGHGKDVKSAASSRAGFKEARGEKGQHSLNEADMAPRAVHRGPRDPQEITAELSRCSSVAEVARVLTKCGLQDASGTEEEGADLMRVVPSLNVIHMSAAINMVFKLIIPKDDELDF
eukprot:gene4984-34762_t